jgi:hypothetical protein
MGDAGDTFRAMRESLKERKERDGIDCPGCIEHHPKRCPSRLLPGWTCRVCGYTRCHEKRGVGDERVHDG